VHCVRFLAARGCELIDCQVPSAHLLSLGAVTMPRDRFLVLLASLTADSGHAGSWAAEFEAAVRCGIE
jgi:leucyl/phenylalanyl-tRNA--protein transferase